MQARHRAAWRDNTYHDTLLVLGERQGFKDRPKERTGTSVYFLHAQGLRRVKIGFSRRPPARLSAIKRLIPPGFDLRLVGVIDGGRRTEQCIHERFSDHRISGEWFHDSILEDIHELIAEDRDWFGDAA